MLPDDDSEVGPDAESPLSLDRRLSELEATVAAIEAELHAVDSD